MLGLISSLPWKNRWTIAEHAEDPGRMECKHLLGNARCDAEAVRDDLRDYVLDHFGARRACRWSIRPPIRGRHGDGKLISEAEVTVHRRLRDDGGDQTPPRPLLA